MPKKQPAPPPVLSFATKCPFGACIVCSLLPLHFIIVIHIPTSLRVKCFLLIYQIKLAFSTTDNENFWKRSVKLKSRLERYKSLILWWLSSPTETLSVNRKSTVGKRKWTKLTTFLFSKRKGNVRSWHAKTSTVHR